MNPLPPDIIKDMVKNSFIQMVKGGIYDQLGGGFSRYSTDEKWLVPHFEKMLYDNSQLIAIGAQLYQITRDPWIRQVTEDTIRYVERDLGHSAGGFYSAEDADSEGKEGTFYLWTETDIRKILQKKEADIFIYATGVTTHGNFMDPHTRDEGQNVLSQVRNNKEVASKFNISEMEVETLLQQSKKILFDLRSKRIRPSLDDKIITEWNGLMISALAKAAGAFENIDYLKKAQQTAVFLEKHLYDMGSGQLYRRWRSGERKILAQQIDYAMFIQGLLDLYQADGEFHWLELAKTLQSKQDELFFDSNSGGYFMAEPAPDLIVRLKDHSDNVLPSGNSISLINLLKLYEITSDASYRKKAQQTIECFALPLTHHSGSLVVFATALDMFQIGWTSIAIVGPRSQAQTAQFSRTLLKFFQPRTLLLYVDTEAPDTSSLFPAYLKSMKMLEDQPTIYICRNFTCEAPLISLENFEAAIKSSS
jgi:uncharacterized protein YyaL (SSP411 family)